MDFTTTTVNMTTEPPGNSGDIPVSVGFITLVISIIFYGSFFVPVKKYETGDGMFFQLILSVGIWTTAFLVNWIRNFPKFYALPMLCGFLWSTGNITSVPIIKFIGLALGMLIWGVVSLIIGWANARFGIWGNKAQIPKIVWMNYVGVALAIVSAVIYVFVKTEVSTEKVANKNIEANSSKVAAIEQPENKLKTILKKEELTDQEPTFIDKINPNLKRILGVVLSVFSGVMYGFNYAPILYVADNYPNASQNHLDYVYSFYSGLLASSLLYFLIYCIVKKNKPVIYQNIIIPGFLSGCMWGVANCCFLIASSSISQAVTFPIGASGPPMVASMWGILVYKEVQGKRNLIILGCAFLITVVGAILSGLSK